MQSLILIVHVLAAIAIIALVLMQHGRGADVGASFGSGSANTMFGSAGAMPFLMKVTAICAGIFFLTSMSLTFLASRSENKMQMIDMPAMPAQVAPAKPVTANTDASAGISFTPSAPATNAPEKK
jgi:preprotein translocase subunit SecG